jgi:hypothetical protein
MVVPHLVDKDAVHAHGEDFNTQLFEFFVFLGDRRDFRRSDKGEVTRVETQRHPFPEIF